MTQRLSIYSHLMRNTWRGLPPTFQKITVYKADCRLLAFQSLRKDRSIKREKSSDLQKECFKSSHFWFSASELQPEMTDTRLLQKFTLCPQVPSKADSTDSFHQNLWITLETWTRFDSYPQDLRDLLNQIPWSFEKVRDLKNYVFRQKLEFSRELL